MHLDEKKNFSRELLILLTCVFLFVLLYIMFCKMFHHHNILFYCSFKVTYKPNRGLGIFFIFTVFIVTVKYIHVTIIK